MVVVVVVIFDQSVSTKHRPLLHAVDSFLIGTGTERAFQLVLETPETDAVNMKPVFHDAFGVLEREALVFVG